MPRNLENMTPAQREQFRQYQAEKKRQSRARKKQAGECINCPNKAKPNGVTCKQCDAKSVEYDRANGWRQRPARIIERRALTLRRSSGFSVNEILRDPVIVENGGTRAEVSDVLKRYELL